MKNIEKLLYKSIYITKETLPMETFLSYAKTDSNNVLNILFTLLTKYLEENKNELDPKYINKTNYYIELLTNNEEIDIKYLKRKLVKLIEKISLLKGQKPSNSMDILETLEKQSEKLYQKLEDKQNSPYEFVQYLIENLKDFSSVAYIFQKTPRLIEIKDQRGVPLYKNIINKYINSIELDDETEILYYTNLILLLLTLKPFVSDETKRREVLEEIKQKIKILTKDAVANNKKINSLNTVKNVIEESNQKQDSLNLATKYNIKIPFSERLAKEISFVDSKEPTNYCKRHTINDTIITIDSKNTVEIDDGLSCKKLDNGNYLLGVHIASVLGYLSYDSFIIDEAIKRGRTIYLIKKQAKEKMSSNVILMLPEQFSCSTASLREDKPKLTRSYYFEITKNGEIVAQQFLKSVITMTKNMTYNDIDHVLKYGSKNKEIQELILNLQAVTESLSTRYKKSSKKKEKSTDSQEIVNIAMTLTGNRVATFFANSGYPCVYRVQKKKDSQIKDIKQHINSITTSNNLWNKELKSIYYSIDNMPSQGYYALSGKHEELGLEHYCHCTCNLRRAADIILEHALEVCFDQVPTYKDIYALETELTKRTKEINAKERSINLFEQEYQKTYTKKRN